MDLPERFNPFRIFVTSLNRRISDFDHQGQRRSGKRKNENENGVKDEKKEKEKKVGLNFFDRMRCEMSTDEKR